MTEVLPALRQHIVADAAGCGTNDTTVHYRAVNGPLSRIASGIPAGARRGGRVMETTMGILDSVIGGLLGGGQNAQGGGSPLGGIVSSVLGGGQGGQPGAGAGALGGAGGIGGLLSQFQQAGLGHIAESWIGNGANQSVSPDQLMSVFGQGQTQAMADQAGMDHGDFLQQLSQQLPQAVDGATPNGQAADGSMNV